MNILDISWPLTSDMTGYKDRKDFAVEHIKTFENDQVRQTTICLSSHAGTHVDAPAHFLQEGATVEKTDLKALIGPCKVLDCTHINERITDQDLEKFPIGAADIILLKTNNSFYEATAPFNSNFVYVDESAAHYLVEKKIKTIGIDYLGIERNQADHQTHRLLMKNNITIVEGLRLAEVTATHYQFVCLPLAVIDTEAAPARAVLLETI